MKNHTFFPARTHIKAGVALGIGTLGALTLKNPLPLGVGVFAALGVYGDRAVDAIGEENGFYLQQQKEKEDCKKLLPR